MIKFRLRNFKNLQMKFLNKFGHFVKRFGRHIVSDIFSFVNLPRSKESDPENHQVSSFRWIWSFFKIFVAILDPPFWVLKFDIQFGTKYFKKKKKYEKFKWINY